MTEMLPPYLASDLADFERGAFDEDPDACMEFFGALIRHGDVPWRIERLINAAIDKGLLSPAGDPLHSPEGHWHIAALTD